MRLPTLILLAAAFCATPSAQAQKKAVIAYYSGSPEALDKYDPREYSHIIYCFGHLKGDRLHLRGARDTLLIRKMVAMKKVNPKLKVLLSLGGWGGCGPCSEVFSTAGGRQGFSASVKELTDFFGTDGIDLDWEYPVIAGYPGHRYAPEDKDNFTELVRSLRKSLGRKSTITFAAGGFQKFLEEAVDWKAVMPMVDYVNLMTYDLVSGFASVTGHHTALYSTPMQKESADNCATYLTGIGVPSKKLIVGAAFYARTFVGVAPKDNGLYQSCTFKDFIGFDQFPKRISEAVGFKMHWDETAQAPYAYRASDSTYATFDDRRSVAAKARYVKEKNLGGIMFWQLGHDLPKDGLVASIRRALGMR